MDTEKFMLEKKELFVQFLAIYEELKTLDSVNRQNHMDQFFTHFFNSVYARGADDANLRISEIFKSDLE